MQVHPCEDGFEKDGMRIVSESIMAKEVDVLPCNGTHLYLMCYAWRRYRQFSNNLVDAMAYHMKQLEDESSALVQKSFLAEQVRRQQDTPQIGRLLLIYVDDTVADATPFGNVRQRAYKIMPRDTLQITGQRLSVKPVSKLALHWQAVDSLTERIRRHLRPLLNYNLWSTGSPAGFGPLDTVENRTGVPADIN